MKNATPYSTRQQVLLHRIACLIGGFLASYAVMHTGLLASAQTLNLIDMVHKLCSGQWTLFALLFGGALIYILAIVLCAVINHRTRFESRVISMLCSLVCLTVYLFLPASLPVSVQCYPSFFMAATIWVSFTTPGNSYASSSIFSTNNLRQTIYSLTVYALDKEKEQKEKGLFFLGSLCCFHIGVIYGYFACVLLNRYATIFCYPLVILNLFLLFFFLKKQQAKSRANS